MIERWLISVQWRELDDLHWKYETFTINVHPIVFMNEHSHQKGYDRVLVILFAVRVPEEHENIEIEG